MVDHPGLMALLGVCALVAGAAMLAASGRREREMQRADRDPHVGDTLLMLCAVILGTGGAMGIVIGLVQLIGMLGR